MGETGTGKELVARGIHAARASRTRSSRSIAARSRQPGRGRALRSREGRLHRARSTQVGWFVAANGGTLLLDEIGDLPLRSRSSSCASSRSARSCGSAARARSGRRARACRHQPRPRCGGRRRSVPPGPLLPAQRRHHPAAAAPRAARRHPARSPGNPHSIATRRSRPPVLSAAALSRSSLSVAGQHPRAGERDSQRGAARPGPRIEPSDLRLVRRLPPPAATARPVPSTASGRRSSG